MTVAHHLAALATRLTAASAPRTFLGESDLRLLALLADEYPPVPDHEPDPQTDRVVATARRFALTPLDLDLLTVAAAGDLDPRFGAAYGVLLGADRWSPTVALALELCGVGTLSGPARQRLAATAPLRRHGLLTVAGDGPMLLRTLAVPDRVVGHLLGDDSMDADVATLVVRGPARSDEVAERLARGFGSGAVLAHVRARPGTAGVASARGAFAELDSDVLTVDLSRLGGTEDAGRRTALAVREAGLRGAGLVVCGADRSLVADRSVLTALEDAAVPVVVVDDVAWESGWFRGTMLSADATPLTRPERAEMWRAALDGPPATDDPHWLNLVGLRMTPEHLDAAVETARTAAAAAEEPVSIETLHDAAREQGRVRLESAGVRTVPRATLDDLLLPPITRQALDEMVSWARNREALLGSGRLTGRGTKGHGLTALFAGSAGTGKTLAAEAVAGELGLELCTIDLSLVVDKYIGETEKHLEQVISEAENLNVVLFFDEADSLFGARSAVTDSRDRYANQEVAYLLQRIERFEGLAVLATNLRGNLDAAFTRRLHHVITFTDPDAATRRRLWEVHLAEVAAYDEGDPLDLDWLVEAVELTGGDIRNIVMTAAFAAAAEPSAVGMRHVLYAVEREYRKQAKRMPAAPSQRLPT